MDFGAVGLESLVGAEGGFAPLFSEAENRDKWCGSGVSKHGRSAGAEVDWRVSKIAKADGFGASSSMPVQSKNLFSPRSGSSVFSDGQQQQLLLSFSTSKPESIICGVGVAERSHQNSIFPYYQSSSAYGRNTGLGSGSLYDMNHGAFAGAKGPFTPSQWMELEHQALIYKLMTANMPIPTNLLIPLRRNLCQTGYSAFSAGSLRPNSLAWGSFHLGFSGSTDPEPGRCRRTDGKKWRCSRDAVADQKYCERHMNRGRHRSRKPVEGQIGHASTGTAVTVAQKAMLASMASSASAAPSCGTSNSLIISQQQMKCLQPGTDQPTSQISSRRFHKMNVGDHMEDSPGLSISSPADQKSEDASLPIPKGHHDSSKGTSRAEFGIFPPDSLLNPHGSFYGHDEQESQSHPLRHFIDNWPKSPSDHTPIAWPEVEKIKSDQTQLSISIPVASSDFSSSASSPIQEHGALSPLKLSCEFDPVPMGLRVGGIQGNWIPVSWEPSIGGPLGEVLKKTNTTSSRDQNDSTSALNLMTKGWDSSPQIRYSPTGVLQKTVFGSFSNSSAGSSPRAEMNKPHEHTSPSDDLLGSNGVNSSVPCKLQT